MFFVENIGDCMILLDLFCKAGGAGMGYHRAGFDVVGVDIEPQKNYPFEFVQADAIEYLADRGKELDAIHASPPCQAYSKAMKHLSNGAPMLIDETRDQLAATGRLWVIENVEGAPLATCSTLWGEHGVLLCGTMFGMRIFRHRKFETNFKISQPKPCDHTIVPLNPHRADGDPGGPIAGRARMRAEFGNDINCEKIWAKEMGVDWMSRLEARQAIPPAFTEVIGRRLIQGLSEVSAA